jgi:hypothetical protein
MDTRTRISRAALALVVALGCGSHAAPSGRAPTPPRSVAPSRPAPSASCPAHPDLGDVLGRHAAKFGSEAAAAASLPRRARGHAEINGSKGAYAHVLGKEQSRMDMSVAGIPIAAGFDRRGAWSLALDGVVHRLEREEAIGVAFDDWLSRRRYLRALDARRDVVRCTADSGQPRITVDAKLPELGNPQLVFAMDSASLESASHERPDGSRATLEFRRWSELEGGVRWPTEWAERPDVGSPIHVSVTTQENRVACDDGCAAVPVDRFVIAWPKEERFTLPMKLYARELSFSAEVNGRKTWALLDSGAGLSAVDATTPLGAAFTPALQVEGAGATQKLMLGLGEIRDVRLGTVALPRLPVVSVPIPALDDFGARRPELIVGYSVFAAAAVRVDYRGSVIVLARTAEKLHDARASSVPIRYWDGKPVVEFEVDGSRGFIELDTGNGGGVSMHARWAKAHGFPGGVRTVDVRYLAGAGTKETVTTLWRARSVMLGPIRVENRIVQIDDPPSGPNLAGLIGNGVFARCAAVIFDLRERRVWFEPPCDRKVPEDLAGWHLERKIDPAFPERPWTVGRIVPGGSAARAGLLPTDRLLAVDGRPATLDRTSFEDRLEQPKGTQVRVDIVRDGKKQTVLLPLWPILDD